jgi:hypothetical protein
LSRPTWLSWPDRTPPEPDSGQEQERAGPDEHWLDRECGTKSEVVGETPEQVRGGDDEHAAE